MNINSFENQNGCVNPHIPSQGKGQVSRPLNSEGFLNFGEQTDIENVRRTGTAFISRAGSSVLRLEKEKIKREIYVKHTDKCVRFQLCLLVLNLHLKTRKSRACFQKKSNPIGSNWQK